ncbi:MAG: ribonucleoside-diphosphate reductase [Halobacteria archaeon]
MNKQTEGQLQIDHGSKMYRYFRNAVDRHWNPYEIDLEQDREELLGYDFVNGRQDFEYLCRGVALFGAGEQSVTEDLAPLAVAYDDIEDEMFVTTQMYEEAKHAEFFDRYWSEVIHPVEEERGYEKTYPTDERYFVDVYNELFEKNQEAMERLLEEDTPANRVKAHGSYHLVVEGILGQTGYYGTQKDLSDYCPKLPNLPGLVEGFSNIRSDEGRHIGFGMTKIKEYMIEDGVGIEALNDQVNEMIPLVNGIVSENIEPEVPGMPEAELLEYASSKHTERMRQITSSSEDIPEVEELVRLEGSY